MSAAFTPPPWKFESGESAIELARLKGETLEPHEGYYRTNSGAWIVTFAAEDEDGFSAGGQICEVAFKGTAKRGEAYRAPDPEGQANAKLIAAAPDGYALAEWIEEQYANPNLNHESFRVEAAVRADRFLAKARTALAKAGVQ